MQHHLPVIGVGTPLGFGLGPRVLVDYARAADEVGLLDISVGELRSTEVFGLTAAIAAATTNLAIETSVVAAVTRSPTLIAMGAATVAQLSGGRFRLGLGAGSPMVAGWHGSDFTRPLRTVERTLDLVRTALAGERVPELGNFRLAPEVVIDVPITLAAMNERMLQLAGRKADGVVLQFCGPEQAARMAGVARHARRGAGIGAPFSVTVNVWGFAGADRDDARRAFRREVGPYLAVPTYRNAAIALSSAAAVDAAAERWRTGGRDAAAAAVPDSVVEALLVVLGADDVGERLAAYGRAGCDRVRVIPLTPVAGDPGNAFAVVQALAAWPALAGVGGAGGR